MTKGTPITALRGLAVVLLGCLAAAAPAAGQESFGYRDYALGSSVDAVSKLSKTRPESVRTVHERPARIQEIEWRAPYVSLGTDLADPVRDILFRFYDDELYRVVVTYDRNRMEGLTSSDLIEAISRTYGVPLLRHGTVPRMRPENGSLADTTRVATWEDAASVLSLTRGTYSMQYELVLLSKALNARAEAAIAEAIQLDTKEAPGREREQRAREVVAARDANDKARTANKAGFKP